jgi:hypothetical protein
MSIHVTAERFAQGMTFEEYLGFIASPENLMRESTNHGVRSDTSGAFRAAYERFRLTDDQTEALRWLCAQSDGPAKMLAISEDWSSDCQRDIPTMARIAEATSMELRIFNRDGHRFGDAPEPDPESPNADLMSQFLNAKKGAKWQSIPVVAFFTRDMEYLYHYTEYPAIYNKDRLVIEHIRAPREGETPEQSAERSGREFTELRRTPFFRIWASAAVDEIASCLQRRLVLGAV